MSGVDGSGEPRWLPIHFERRATPDGRLTTRAQVLCPRAGGLVPLRDCKLCTHEVAIDRRERGVFLVCNAPHEAAALEFREDDGADRTTVMQLMNRHVVTIDAATSLARAGELLIEYNVSGLPVTDGDGKPIGVVSKTDFARALNGVGGSDDDGDWELSTADVRVRFTGVSARDAELITVRQAMTPMVLTLDENASVGRAAALMAFEGVHRIVVVDAREKVVGILSSLDILRHVASRSGYVVPPLSRPPTSA